MKFCPPWFAPILLAAVFAALAGCSQSPDVLLEQAKAAQAKGDVATAIIRVKGVLQERPDDAETRFLLGQLYNEAADGISAEKELRWVRERGLAKGGQVDAELANALWLSGDFQGILKDVAVPSGATAEFRAAILAFRGRAQRQMGDLAGAKETFAKAREAAGSLSVPAVVLLHAHIRIAERNLPEALKLIETVLTTNPRLYDALRLKADLLVAQQGNDDATAGAYGAILKLYPTDLFALVGRSTLFIRLGKFDEAQKDIQVLESAHSGHFAGKYQAGLLSLRKGQFRTAIEAFQAAQKRNPTFYPALRWLGIAQMAVGEARQAERALTQYLKQAEGDTLARRMLVAAYLQLNEPARALEVIAPMLRGDNPDLAFLNLAAEAHFRLGEVDKAAELFGKAAERAGPGSVADERRAMMRMAAGEHDAALEDLARIASVRKGVSNVDVALVFGYLRKDVNRALALIDELDKKIPRQPFLFNLKGVALLKKGEKEAAIAAFDEALKIQPSFLPAAANLFKLDVEQGELDQGRQRFVSVLKSAPNHYQALLALAEFEQATNKPKEATTLLKRATIAHPHQAEPWVRLVTTLLHRGHQEDAMQAAQDFLNRNAKNFVAMELIGKVLLAQGDANSAVASYGRLVSDYPKSEKAYLGLAEAQLAARRVADAERSLRNIVDMNPDHAEGRLAWVGLMVREKRADEARRYAQSLQKTRANAPIGWVLEAEIHWAQSKFSDAAKLFQTALTMAPRHDLAIRFYEAQAKAGDAKGALTGLQQFVEKHPTALPARLHLAEVLVRQGEFAAAIKHYEPATKLASVNSMVLNNLAYAYHKLKDPRALSVAEQAHHASPESPVILDTLGMILLRDGDPKRARELFEKALKRLPRNPEIRYHYAEALQKTGDVERAKSELTELLRRHKKFPQRDEAAALLKSIGG